MEAFQSAVQAVFPTLFFLLSGMLLKRWCVISDQFAIEGNSLCMNLLFPVLIFQSISQDSGDFISYLHSIVFVYGVIAVSNLMRLMVIPRLVHNRCRIPTLVQLLYRGNFTLYGIPLSQVLGGTAAAAIASSVAAATLPVLNVIAVMMFAYYTDQKRVGILLILLKVLKNPIMWGVFLGLAFRLLPIELPHLLQGTLSSFAEMSSPMAFLILGSGLRLDRMLRPSGTLLATVGFKLLVMPLIFLPLAILQFHMKGMKLIPVFLFLAAPSAITTYQLAVQFNAENELAGDVVMLSTFFSAFTLCICVFLLKCTALI